MATTEQIALKESPVTLQGYLRTSFQPDAEFVNGEVEERNLGEYDHSSVQWARIKDYRKAGVAHIWMVDPSRRVGWDCSDGNWIAKARFEVSNRAAYLDLPELFQGLDEAEA
jgi:hypothetical protein